MHPIHVVLEHGRQVLLLSDRLHERLAFEKIRPLNSLEEGVLLDQLNVPQPLHRILYQQLFDQVFTILTNVVVIWELNILLNNLLEQQFGVRRVERTDPVHELVQTHADRPEVAPVRRLLLLD